MIKQQDQDIIDSIFRVRVRNNDPWKRLLEIALTHAPAETHAVLREIAANDQTITTLMQELGHRWPNNAL